MADEPAHYRFGPLERRGLLSGWRATQLAIAAGALGIAVGVMNALPGTAGLAAGMLSAIAGLGLALFPIGGRTLDQWLPVVARHTWRTGKGRWRALAGTPGAGHLPGGALSKPSGTGPLAACRLVACQDGDDATCRPAVVHDRVARTYSAALGVSGGAFVLTGAAEQEQRIASWGALLAGLAREGSLVHRIQWIERSLPEDPGALRGYAQERRRHSASLRKPALADAESSYDRLLATAAPVSRCHETLVVLSVHAGRAARAIRAAGGGDVGGRAVCLREVAHLENQLRHAGIDVAGVLTGRELGAALARSYLPSPSAAGGARWDDAGAWPWPLGWRAGWAELQLDATWHATYWIAEWPRTDVGADFLSPLLLGCGARRTVSVTMEPLSPLAATRQVERARTGQAADAELRRRAGFLESARRRREAEGVSEREAELADGHAEYRFSGYVTVSATSAEELEEACGEVEQSAGQARLFIRRLYGEQDEAFCCTLPLGRGLA